MLVSDKTIHLIQEHHGTLRECWLNKLDIDGILEQIGSNRALHEDRVISAVLDYLIAELSGRSPQRDCPVIRQLVETFYAEGLELQDVFLHCAELKNCMHTFLHEKKVDPSETATVIMTLDQNLYHILAIYTDYMKDQQNRIALQNRIMEEHMLLTVTDQNGVITRVTDAFCRLTGYSKEELIGKTHALLRHEEMAPNFFEGLWSHIRRGRPWRGTIRNRKKDGGEFVAKTEIIPIMNEGDATEFMAVRHDITDRELSWLDSLTGVYNRRRLDVLMGEMLPSSTPHSLVMVDLDHFKAVNDRYGHPEGDKVIQACAKTIRESVRAQDVVCRWGGEEFVIFLPDTTMEIAGEIAERIRKQMASKRFIGNLTVTCSIGVSQTIPGEGGASVFARVDALLYEAKRSGRNCIIVRQAS